LSDEIIDVHFFVPGKAAPKGSRTMYRGRSVESSKEWPTWKEAIATVAIAERAKGRTRRFADAVTLTVTFLLPKPKRPKHERHITRPDLDKLVRGVCDALTGVLWEDDSQVTCIMAVKRYADEDDRPGVYIRVAESV
jgi:crossover junction endodeoxyribonuclease RusA